MPTLPEIIRSKEARVSVIGLGYVGLPLAVEIAKAGFETTGIDLDTNKVNAINDKKNYIRDVSSETLARLVEEGRLRAFADFSPLSRSDFIIICVPTPLSKGKNPDISYIVSAVTEIKKNLRKDQMIVLESTTYPGTTEELVLPILEETGLKAGRDFFLAFSPERIDPGNKKYGLKNTPKVVGGITAVCTEMAQSFYGSFVDRVVPISSSRAAEMVKLLENTFRAINIGLANEIAIMCDRMHIDTWEVIEAAATKPFGIMPFYPGPGLGGHCIPIDPHYLMWKLKSLDYNARFIQLADEINSAMPHFVVDKIVAALNGDRKSVNGSKVLILGVAYKRDIDDFRESPALDVMELLEKKGAEVLYHDPYVPRVHVGNRDFTSSPMEEVKRSDCVAILTDHSCFDIQKIVGESALLVDTRNATRSIQSKNIFKI